MEKKKNDFIVFCIELFKDTYHLTGEETFDIFKQYGALDYLSNGYEMLHTEGDRWIINDIYQFLKIRGYDLKEDKSNS